MLRHIFSPPTTRAPTTQLGLLAAQIANHGAIALIALRPALPSTDACLHEQDARKIHARRPDTLILINMDLEQLRNALLPRYQLGERIGEGAMSVVYRGRTEFGTEVAIKLLSTSASDRAEAQARFQREIATLRRLHHASLLSVVDAGVIDTHAYMVTPLIDGVQLSQLLRTVGRLSAEHAVAIAQSVTAGLAHAHSLGIIHRDIKPSNVRIPTAGEPAAMLLDFGVLGELGFDSRETRAGQIFGTPLYMAPEQWRGEPQSTETDVYGIGMLMFEMLYGRPPFTETNIAKLGVTVISTPIVLPDAPAVAHDLKALVLRCLGKSRGDRPKDGTVLLAALRGLSVQAAPFQLPKPPLPEPSEKRHAVIDRPFDEPAAAAPAVNSPLAPKAPVASSPDPRDSTLRPRVPAASPSQSSTAPWADATPNSNVESTVATTVAPSASSAWWWSTLVLGAALLATLIAWGLQVGRPVSSSPDSSSMRVSTGIGLGLALIALGGAVAWALSRVTGLAGDVGQRATALLLGTSTRQQITETIAIEIDELIRRCRTLDERLIGRTVALMMDEYSNSSSPGDRRAALVEFAELLKRLEHRLSPWYIRYQKPIQYLAAVSGLIAGVVQIVKSLG